MRVSLAVTLASLLLLAATADAQPLQIDPNVPTNIPPEDLDNFKSFLDTVMDDIVEANGATILDAGNLLWRGLAGIVVVWTGIKIAMSGSFSIWTIVDVVIGLWIPWVMLLFYSTPIPGVGFTFPGMIVGGGNWLMDFFISDIATAMRTELAQMVNQLATSIVDAWADVSWWDLAAVGLGTVASLLLASVMAFIVAGGLILLYAVTYAQVIWAQIAILILTFLGPMMIPWLVFEPMAFLFWGWFRSMIVFSLYGAIAGALMRVFLGVGLGYVTTFATTVSDVKNPESLTGWTLIVVPLIVACLLASLKIGELAGMLVSGGGGGSGGMTGVATMAARSATTGGTGAAAGV